MKNALYALVLLALAMVLLPPMAVSVRADLFVSNSPPGPADSVKRYSDSGTYLGDFAVNPDLAINPNFRGVAFGPDRNLYVVHFNSDKVLRFNGVTGAYIDTFVSSGSGELDRPMDMAFGPDGNMYVVSEYGGNPDDVKGAVLRYNGATGAFVDLFADHYPRYGIPKGLTFGPDGNLYVTENRGVLRYDGSTGAFLDIFVASTPSLFVFRGLTFGPDGDLYLADHAHDQVLRYDGATGAPLGVFASGGGLDGPYDVVFGPDDNLYVSSYYGSYQVLRYDGTTGAFIDAFASGNGLYNPTFMTFFTPVPVPGAVLLGAIGLAYSGWLCRRKTR